MDFKQLKSSNDMENHPHESLDTIFSCVFPYIQERDDRNSVSFVCRNWYELDCMTRKHVTVHVFYSPKPSRSHQRFPSIKSLTLKGLPYWSAEKLSIDINQWIQEIAVSFRRLKSLHIRHMEVHDSDLELLARTRGKDLKVLKICKCKGFSTHGLLHIGKYCNDLRTFCLKGNYCISYNGKWLHELALQNTGIESLDFRYIDIHDVKDLTLLAKNCCGSLVSLKIGTAINLINLVDVFRHAVKLEYFVGGTWVEKQVYVGLKFPTGMQCMGIYNLTKSSFPFVLPFAHRLRELHLYRHMDADSQCLLIQSCRNLEVLYTSRVFGDMGLQVIGQFCKKLRKLNIFGWATQMGLITMVKGCLELECLHIYLTDISNELFECIGTHLKKLRNFHMTLHYKPTSPLDDGIRAMLIGCGKLQRLGLRLHNGGLTDVGLGYIAKYGHNLRYLSLGHLGESAAAGLVCLSKGCPKLRKLEIQSYPFSKETLARIMYDMHMLRYVNDNTVLPMTHPKFQP